MKISINRKGFIQHHKTGAGFTLVELLVVIAIIGILSTVAVVNLNSARIKAKEAAALAWGSGMLPAVVLCGDNSGVLVDFVAGGATNICSVAVSGAVWPTALPADYDTLTLVTNTPAIGVWSFTINDTAATGALGTITCTNNGCTKP
jgi:prepilin-type N-terminal cleavage/methylation domain-containing protein